MKPLLLAGALLFSSICFSQNGEIDVTELIKEIQQWQKDGERMRMTWWIPTNYWRVVLKGNTQVPPEAVSQLENIFSDYVLISVADLNIHSDGTITSADLDKMTQSLFLTDVNGKKHFPMKPENISSEALQVAKNMEPMFAQSLGAMGKGMHLFFFKVKDSDQKNLVDAAKKGGFVIDHSGTSFKWNLPLPILMPEKKCPVDAAKMKGDWVFCPYHGSKL